MAQLLTIMLGSLLRMLLLGAFGALIERGVWTTGQVEQVAVGLAGFISVAAWALWRRYHDRLRFLTGFLSVAAWALYKRYHDRLKFLTALESPPTTEAHIIEKVKSGVGATL
jgi:hypothetical protein